VELAPVLIAPSVLPLERIRWLEIAASHATAVDDLLSQREAAPVEEFLWTYYFLKPAHLRQWHPGAGVVLADAAEFHGRRGYLTHSDGSVEVDSDFIDRKRPLIEKTLLLLEETASRAAQHSCFGLHEWAMVYEMPADQVRHSTWPLRLDPTKIAAVVESLGLRCSHFDAFRFFTPPARPLNLIQPTREEQSEQEQPGCIHANMDLYKIAGKLLPIIPADLAVRTFANARALRRLDMEASPYDLSAAGVLPIRLEESDGRGEYVRRQRELAEASAPLRRELIEHCRKLLASSRT
jgi:hypothetical protein